MGCNQANKPSQNSEKGEVNTGGSHRANLEGETGSWGLRGGAQATVQRER